MISDADEEILICYTHYAETFPEFTPNKASM